MKIKIDDFLTAEHISEADKNNPVYATIRDISFIEAADLPFESKVGKYELLLEIENSETKWLANKTSIRSLMSVFGNDTENWIGKQIKMWVVEQIIEGKLRNVIYAGAE